MIRSCWMLAFILAGVAGSVTVAHAAWPPSGLPMATGPSYQTQPIGLTGPGGELQAFWVDTAPSAYRLYSQHVTIAGTLSPGWLAGGRGIVTSLAAISTPHITPDGFGGAILAWYDYRSIGGPRGVHAIRVDNEAAIVAGWTSSGTPVCTLSTAQGGPINDLVAVCSDGAGGAFVAWTDSRNTPPMSTLVYDVFAQHMLANGALDPVWPAAGRALTSGAGYKYPHALIADGGGGFWLASENSFATSQEAVSHHAADGSPTGLWPTPSFASRVTAVSDGAGGVYVAWWDCRTCGSGGSEAIYAIRLVSEANPAPNWPPGGVQVGASPQNDDLPSIIRTMDGAAVVAWLQSGGVPDDGYIARRVEADGSFGPPWLGGGKAFVTSSDILSGWPLIASDAVGGAMFAFRRNSPNLFGSRVTAHATVPEAFPDTGLSLCSLTGNQFPSSLVSDGLNGAYLLWEDRRDAPGSAIDVYVMRFTNEGQVGATTGAEPPHPPAAITLSAPRPNPARAMVAFDLALPMSARSRVEVLDLAGRSVALLHDGELEAGPHALQWNGRDAEGRRASPGVYLVRARANGGEIAKRIVLLP
ncbi:MAG: FlgD immunoglobulin-like domain containing protein [Candidatus Eisenbacteria bacterium]